MMLNAIMPPKFCMFSEQQKIVVNYQMNIVHKLPHDPEN